MGIELKKTAIDLGLVTTHGEPMLAFYRDVLGLKLLREMPMPGGQGQMFQLACGDSVVKVVVPEREIRPGVRIGIVEDPDGNWVEFLAIAPQ